MDYYKSESYSHLFHPVPKKRNPQLPTSTLNNGGKVYYTLFFLNYVGYELIRATF